MNVFPVLLLVLMPALTAAEVSQFGDCVPGAVNNGRVAGTESNFNQIKGMGELAIMARDPSGKEKGFSCYVLNLLSDSTYELRYKDGDGVVQRFNGSYEDTRSTVPIVNTQDAYMDLDGLPDGVFNNGALFPVVFARDEIIFQTCKFQVFGSTRSTYVAVPLEKAIDNDANSVCGCDDWSSI